MPDPTTTTPNTTSPGSDPATTNTPPSAAATAAAPNGGQPAQPGTPTAGAPASANADPAKPANSEAPATAAAPEKYEFKQVGDVAFDEKVLGAFSDVARKFNLSQEAAQSILETVTPVMRAQAQEQAQAIKTQWAETSRADKEFGGDKLEANTAIAKKAIMQFATPEFVKFLDDSGLGDHPEMIRAWWKAGQRISEDTFVPAGQGGATKTTAQAMYPNTNMNP